MLCIANGRVCCSLKQHTEMNLGRGFRSTTHLCGEDAQPFFDPLSRRHGGGHQRSCPSLLPCQRFSQSRELFKCPACTVSSATPRRKTHTLPSTMFQVSTHYTARPSQLIPTRLRMQLSVCLRKPQRESLYVFLFVLFFYCQSEAN